MAADKIAAVLPDVLRTLHLLGATKLRVEPDERGGFEVSVAREHPLMVSRRELAAMMPRFSKTTNRELYVDKLVRLGMPAIDVTGTKMFQVNECVAWMRNFKRRAA